MLLFYTYLQAAAEAVPYILTKQNEIVVIKDGEDNTLFEIPASFVENISQYFFKAVREEREKLTSSEDSPKEYSVTLPDVLIEYRDPLLHLFEHLSQAQNKEDFLKIFDQFMAKKDPTTGELWSGVDRIKLYNFFSYIGLQFDTKNPHENHENYFEIQERFTFPVITTNSLKLFNRDEMLEGFARYLPPVKLVFDTVETLQRWNGENAQIAISKPMVIKIEEKLSDEKLIKLNEFLNRNVVEENSESGEKIQKVVVEIKGHFNSEGFNFINKMIEDQKILSLDLSHNQIGAEGAQHLAEALKVNSTLTSLDLSYNNTEDAGAQHLVAVLKENKTLTELSLYGNRIGDAGAIALAEALKTNKTLTSLDLSYNNIEDAGAQHLADALKVNSTLTSLDLSANDIRAAGAQHLAEALKVNKTLTSLDLGLNKIGAEGAQALGEALKVNTTLTSLQLLDNQIGDEGKAALRAAQEEARRAGRDLTIKWID